MLKWEKIAVAKSENGESTITYSAGAYQIESRKRLLKSANKGEYYFLHTDYFLLKDGKEVRDCATLKAAKAEAERLDAEEAGGNVKL